MVEGMRRVEILRAACCVAGADQQIGPLEKPFLDRLAAEAGVGLASLEAMMDRSVNHEEFYKEQFSVLSADPKTTMTLLFRIAIVDGSLQEREAEVLQYLADKLDVPSDRFDRWLKQAQQFMLKNKRE